MKKSNVSKYRKNILFIGLFLFVIAAIFKLSLDKSLNPPLDNHNTDNIPFVTSKDFISGSLTTWDQNLFVVDYRNNLFLITPKQQLIQITKDKQVLYLQQSKTHDIAAWIEFDECVEKNYINFECPSRVVLVKANNPQKQHIVFEHSPSIKTQDRENGIQAVSFTEDDSKLVLGRSSSIQDIYKINTDGTTVFEKTNILPMPEVFLGEEGGAYHNYVDPIYSPDRKHLLYKQQLYEGSNHIIFDVTSKSITRTIDSNSYGKFTGTVITPISWIDSENLLVSECAIEVDYSCTYKSLSIQTGESMPLDFNAAVLHSLQKTNESDGKNYSISIVRSGNTETYELKKISIPLQNRQTIIKFPGRVYCSDCITEDREMIDPRVIGLTQDKKFLLLQASIYTQNLNIYHQYDALLAIPVGEDYSQVYQIAVIKE